MKKIVFSGIFVLAACVAMAQTKVAGTNAGTTTSSQTTSAGANKTSIAPATKQADGKRDPSTMPVISPEKQAKLNLRRKDKAPSTLDPVK